MTKTKTFLIFIISFLTFALLGCNSLNIRLYSHLINKKAKVGIAVIKDDRIWVIGNKKKPLMSIFKYMVSLKILNKLDNEKISLDEKIIIKEAMLDRSLYSPMLKKYKSTPFAISIRELLEYSISQSDNNACDILIEYAGGIKEVEKYIHNIGYKDIEILVNEKDMNKDIKKQYLNRATPEDISSLMKNVDESNLLSSKSKYYLYSIMLKTITGENKIKNGLPKNIVIGHKTGSSSRDSNGIKIADNDTAFIILQDGNIYYITVMIENSSMSDAENAKLISDISKTVYEYFANQR